MNTSSLIYVCMYVCMCMYDHFNRFRFTAAKISKLLLMAVSTAVLVREKIDNAVRSSSFQHAYTTTTAANTTAADVDNNGHDSDPEAIDMEESSDLKQGAGILLAFKKKMTL